jgi:peptidoglycan L-alanyl-D-glutamate endopeptidase CwlK
MTVSDFAAAVFDWLHRLFATPPSRPETPPAASASLPNYDGPRPGEVREHSRFGGRAWRYDGDGVHADGTLWRTPGVPATCRAILALHGGIILAAAAKHGVNPALILMTIAAETGAFRAAGFTGPRTFRWEAHVTNRDMIPPFKGSYSAGPMQILATTARDLIARRGADYSLAYKPFATAPAYPAKPSPAPAALPLYDPATSIDLGTAVIRRQLQLTGDDPILVAAAYNSGGLYESRANAWRLRSHGDHLDRAARWYGDGCAVLRERGVL